MSISPSQLDLIDEDLQRLLSDVTLSKNTSRAIILDGHPSFGAISTGGSPWHSWAGQQLAKTSPSLLRLSLVGCGINTLVGMPNFPKVAKLALADNRISDLSELTTCTPGIKALDLGGNRINSLDSLKPLVRSIFVKYLQTALIRSLTYF
jgi:Leucine-rich repeat (LRR) protein